MILTILGGLASVIGFATAGSIAEKIGRKWTISWRPCVHARRSHHHVLCHAHRKGRRRARRVCVPDAAVHRLGDQGLRHGACAQLLVPDGRGAVLEQEDRPLHRLLLRREHVRADDHAVALGFVLDATMAWRTLPVYASILTAASFLVFTLLVKNIKAEKGRPRQGSRRPRRGGLTAYGKNQRKSKRASPEQVQGRLILYVQLTH